MEDKVVGVFAIYRDARAEATVFASRFRALQIPGAHAAEALVCARLFADADHKMPSFDSFFDPEM